MRSVRASVSERARRGKKGFDFGRTSEKYFHQTLKRCKKVGLKRETSENYSEERENVKKWPN